MPLPALASRRDRPVISETGLAIWSYPAAPSTSPDLNLKLEAEFDSPFFLGASKAAPLYLKVYSQLVRGPRLTPVEVATLIHGGVVTGLFVSTSPMRASYRAQLAIGEIQRVRWKSQTDKCDRILRFGRALPREITADGCPLSWEVEKIIFPQQIKVDAVVLRFEPAHAFQCLRLGECQIQEHRVTFAGTEQKGDGALPSAKLQISFLRDQTREESLQSSSASVMQ